MHEDPTRMMGQPDDNRPHGNMRLLIAGLVAVIVGLLIAVMVIAGKDNGDTPTVTVPPTETTSSSTTTTTGSSTETTAPTTTETTSPTPTETTATTVPPTEEENGSGGIGAP